MSTIEIWSQRIYWLMQTVNSRFVILDWREWLSMTPPQQSSGQYVKFVYILINTLQNLILCWLYRTMLLQDGIELQSFADLFTQRCSIRSLYKHLWNCYCELTFGGFGFIVVYTSNWYLEYRLHFRRSIDGKATFPWKECGSPAWSYDWSARDTFPGHHLPGTDLFFLVDISVLSFLQNLKSKDHTGEEWEGKEVLDKHEEEATYSVYSEVSKRRSFVFEAVGEASRFWSKRPANRWRGYFSAYIIWLITSMLWFWYFAFIRHLRIHISKDWRKWRGSHRVSPLRRWSLSSREGRSLKKISESWYLGRYLSTILSC